MPRSPRKCSLRVAPTVTSEPAISDAVRLEGYGYSIFQSSGGEDAIRIARQKRPDVILLDICLPGLSGIDIIKILKKDSDLNKIPIVAVTAFAMPGDEQKIRQAGADFYVSKPISITMVQNLVKEILEGTKLGGCV